MDQVGRIITPQPHTPIPRGAASALALLRDPRVQYVHTGYTVYGPPPALATAVPMTIVVPVANIKYVEDALRCLMLQQYPAWSLLVVCMDTAICTELLQLVANYSKLLPTVDVRCIVCKGNLARALNTALKHIKTDYWCRLEPADLLHPYALQTVAAAFADQADYYYTCQYEMRANKVVLPQITEPDLDMSKLWSGATFPFDQLIVYKTAVTRRFGFRSYDNYPGDVVWIMAYDMLDAGMRLQLIDAIVYYRRKVKLPLSEQEEVEPEEYRAALLALHWPHRYQGE